MAYGFARVISADSHVMEPPDLWSKPLGKKFGDRAPRVIEEYRGRKGRFLWIGTEDDQAFHLDAVQSQIEESLGRRMWEAGYVPEVRVAYQQEQGIAAEVINSTYMLVMLKVKDREVVRACAEVFNDWIAEFCSYSPKRLLGSAVVPIDDVEWGVRELERVDRKGLTGAMINLDTPEGMPRYRDRMYDPFWATAQDLGIPITLHIGSGRALSALALTTPEELEEAPRRFLNINFEIQGVLANEFIWGGVLDRFPGLKLICSEFEISWIPGFMRVADHEGQKLGWRLGLPKPQMRPSEYLQTRVWHGFLLDPFAVAIIPLIGADRVLWGSDFPHPGDTVNPADAADLLKELPWDEQEKVLGSNAAKLFGV